MLRVLVGKDSSARALRLETLLSQLKKEGTEVRVYSDATLVIDDLRAIAGSVSLFEKPIAAVISGIGDVTQQRDAVEAILPELAESSQYFFISESALPAAFLKAVKKTDAVLEESKEKGATKKTESFNIFLLTDAYAARTRSLAWALYRKAIASGMEPREIAGKLFWGIKNMIVAERSKTAIESGQHPFVYSKSKTAAKNFMEGELATYAAQLTMLFHESLIQGQDLELQLEAFILQSLAKKKQSVHT